MYLHRKHSMIKIWSHTIFTRCKNSFIATLNKIFFHVSIILEVTIKTHDRISTLNIIFVT